jgi:hypothetical protein
MYNGDTRHGPWRDICSSQVNKTINQITFYIKQLLGNLSSGLTVCLDWRIVVSEEKQLGICIQQNFLGN